MDLCDNGFNDDMRHPSPILIHLKGNPGLAALIEVALLFIPAIPAYIWMWPNVSSLSLGAANVLTYLYVLVGTVWIGRRRWTWNELGVNFKGFSLTCACASVMLIGRLMIILSVEWQFKPPALTFWKLIGDILFYFCLVGLVEELLFRGLVFLALDRWLGSRWAILGSSFGFMLWHIFGHGILIGITSFFIGLIFALIRSRSGGITGLIIFHGLWDLQTTLLVASSNTAILEQLPPVISYPGWLRLGTMLLVLTPFYLWLIHPRFSRRKPR